MLAGQDGFLEYDNLVARLSPEHRVTAVKIRRFATTDGGKPIAWFALTIGCKLMIVWLNPTSIHSSTHTTLSPTDKKPRRFALSNGLDLNRHHRQNR